MSRDDIESENSLTTLASTSPNSAPPRTELVKSAPKQTQVKFNTMSTSDQLLFHSTTSLTRIRGNKVVPLPFDRSHHSSAQVVIRVNLMIHWIQTRWAMIHWISNYMGLTRRRFRAGRVMRTDVNHSPALHLIQFLVITELVKSAPKQTKEKFNTMSTNDQLLFHSQPASPELEATRQSYCRLIDLITAPHKLW